MRPEITYRAPRAAAPVAPRAATPAAAPGVTPAVQQLALALGVNVKNLAGTGAGGRVTTGDVRRAADAQVINDSQAAQLAQMTGLPKGAFIRG